MSNSIGTGFSPTASGASGFTTGSLGSLLKLVSGIGYPYDGPGPKLGGGLPGLMPQSIILHNNDDSFARTRFLLKNGWNTSSYSGSSYPRRITGPFRAVNNAGDLLSRENYSCGGSCQTPVVWSSLQLNTNVPSSTCNVKFVYDGSDYITFKRNQAMNRNYNDRSFGGNDYNTSQSAIRHIRRY